MPGEGVRVPGEGVRVPGEGVRVPGEGVRVPGEGVRVPGEGVRGGMRERCKLTYGVWEGAPKANAFQAAWHPKSQ